MTTLTASAVQFLIDAQVDGRALAEDGLPVFDAEHPIGLDSWPTMFGSKLPFGPGTALWLYWVSGKGAAKWMSSPKPWTTLRSLLIKYVGPKAAGLTTNIMLASPQGRALFKKHHQGVAHAR